MEPGKRLASLDVLRGMDMLLIMGLSALIAKLCTAFGWGSECWLAQQVRHVAWDGLAL